MKIETTVTYEIILCNNIKYKRFNPHTWFEKSNSQWGNDISVRGNRMRTLEKQYQEMQQAIKLLTS